MILHYSKGDAFVWNPPREPLEESYSGAKYTHDDGDGRGPYRLDNLTSPKPRPNMMYEFQGCRDATELSGATWAYDKVPQAKFDAFTGATVEALRRFLAAGGGQQETTA